MRIFQLVSSLGEGGAERFVTDLCVELSSRNCDVHLVVLESAAHIGKSSEYENMMIKHLKEKGVIVHINPKGTRHSVVSTTFFLRKLIKNFKPDIIHSHLLIWSVYLSLCSKGVAKTLYTQHINWLRFPYLHKYFISTFTDKYIAICDPAVSSFLKYIDERKVTKIINGIPIKKFNNNIQRNENDHQFRIITVSRLSAQKNHIYFLEALTKLISTRPDLKPIIKVSIVGDGPLREELEKYVDENELREIVELLGTRNDVDRLLLGSDLFCMPSNYEGFSIALIEALCSGLDIIATDVGGNSEILQGGRFGELITLNNAEEFVNVLERKIDSRGITRSIDGLKDHLTDLSIESCSGNHANLYKRLIKENC